MIRIVVVTAVRAETRAALRALSGPRRVRPAARPCWEGWAGSNHVTVVEGGVGHEAARRAVSVPAAPCDLLVSLGFAGALAPGLAPGALVLSGTIIWEEESDVHRYDVPHEIVQMVEAALPPDLRRALVQGALLSSALVVATPAEKEQAARHFGAVAVEMEAAALAAIATGRGIGFLPLRAILDPADLSLAGLPENLDRSWAARVSLVGMPATWPLLVRLRHHLGAAGATLTRAATAVLPALGAENP
jgi:nucleoside phosphorylase